MGPPITPRPAPCAPARPHLALAPAPRTARSLFWDRQVQTLEAIVDHRVLILGAQRGLGVVRRACRDRIVRAAPAASTPTSLVKDFFRFPTPWTSTGCCARHGGPARGGRPEGPWWRDPLHLRDAARHGVQRSAREAPPPPPPGRAGEGGVPGAPGVVGGPPTCRGRGAAAQAWAPLRVTVDGSLLPHAADTRACAAAGRRVAVGAAEGCGRGCQVGGRPSLGGGPPTQAEGQAPDAPFLPATVSSPRRSRPPRPPRPCRAGAPAPPRPWAGRTPRRARSPATRRGPPSTPTRAWSSSRWGSTSPCSSR